MLIVSSFLSTCEWIHKEMVWLNKAENIWGTEVHYSKVILSGKWECRVLQNNTDKNLTFQNLQIPAIYELLIANKYKLQFM